MKEGKLTNPPVMKKKEIAARSDSCEDLLKLRMSVEERSNTSAKRRIIPIIGNLMNRRDRGIEAP